MKRTILFIAVLVLAGTIATAKDKNNTSIQDGVTKRYRPAYPITFKERGITFFVNPKGDVDFITPNRRTRRRSEWNIETYSAPGTSFRYNSSNRSFVQYDDYGRVIQVGQSNISYNRFNQVRRIGTVSMRYDRRGLLSQVGNLRIHYNRYDQIWYMEGTVHLTVCDFCNHQGCTTNHRPAPVPNCCSDGNHDHKHKKRKKNRKHYDDDDDDDDDHHYKNRKRNKKHDDD